MRPPGPGSPGQGPGPGPGPGPGGPGWGPPGPGGPGAPWPGPGGFFAGVFNGITSWLVTFLLCLLFMSFVQRI